MSKNTTLSNEELIAAIPELMAVLKEAKRKLGKTDRKKIRKAIAKVETGAPRITPT